MKYCILTLGLSTLFLTCFLNVAVSQTSADTLQLKISYALEKVYPATVKIREYDTVKNLPKGGAFSGVVVSSDGYILTAAHATKPKQAYLISFPDGSSSIADGLGRISHLDAATLKIKKKGSYPFADMERLSVTKPGETVISLGYPYTMNSGILPIIRVGAVKNNTINSYIQSSCLMEPGDSGGPLFDLQGKLVGIHSNILYTEDENFEVPIAIFQKHRALLFRQGNYFREHLTDSPDFRSVAASKDADTSISRVKTQLALQNGELLSYTYRIQSGSAQGNMSTNGILLQLNMVKKDRNKSYILSSSSAIGTNPVVIGKQKQFKASVVKRDTINDLALLEVSGLKPNVAGVKTDSGQIEFKAGTFCLSPVKNKIMVGVIGIIPFHAGYNTDLGSLPAAKIVLQDAPMSDEECGGPVFDSKLRFVGLNLKRYNRTSVVIVPYAAILAFLSKPLNNQQTK